jgi:rubrerythrin
MVELRKHRKTFPDVLYNCDDQVIVRQLIDELVPEQVQLEIVNRFNAHVDRYNEIVERQKAQASRKDDDPWTCSSCDSSWSYLQTMCPNCGEERWGNEK